MNLISLKNLNGEEKRTFGLHVAYFAIEGVVLGIIALNEYVFIRSMGGTNYQLAFLFQFSMLVFIFLFFFNSLRKRIRNKKLMLRITAIITRLPLFFVLFFPRDAVQYTQDQRFHYIFLGLFLIYYFGNIIIFPAINVLLKTNYRHQNFGKLYSYSASINKIILLISTFLYGILLDANNFAFVYVFPLMSALSIISVFLLSKIDYSKLVQETSGKNVWDSMKVSFSGMVNILKTNKPYLHFEIGFMFYGFAFMASYTIINIFFKEVLNLNYTSVAFYKNAYNLLAIIMLPYFGRLLGKIDPRKFAAITFGTLLMYVFFIMITEYIPDHFELWNIDIYYTLIASFIFYGLFAATMALLWNIGSAYFCKPEEADDYQSVHLSLTGLRSVFSPVLGVFLFEVLGFTTTFSITIVSLLIGMLLMRWSYRKDVKLRG